MGEHHASASQADALEATVPKKTVLHSYSADHRLFIRINWPTDGLEVAARDGEGGW